MKTTVRFASQLFVFALIIAAFYSFRNVYTATAKDPITKNGIALTGTQEVPAVDPSGSGTLDVSYDKSTKTLTYTAKWSGMTDSVTMMHFHGPAAKGANAGVVYPIHEFTPGTSGTATGSFKLDDQKMKESDLLSGKWYFNIHTKTHPSGEIRGQVEL
jgi:hypothetical protein